MIFGHMPPDDAEGAILAHSQKAGTGTFKKGRILSRADIAALKEAGVTSVVAARLEVTDVPEDEAAAALADALAGKSIRVAAPFTGRANLYATGNGVLEIDAARIHAINAIGEALTVATLAPFETVADRQMLATVKVIPFAVPRAELDKALDIARSGPAPIALSRFEPHRIGLVATQLPGTKESVLTKSRAVLDARLATMGSTIAREIRAPHDTGAIADAVRALAADGLSPILVFGASATVDRRDVVPAGIVMAGGDILHFGMPVDPGNLMLLARLGETPVIGLPGCARSPKLNGCDWVLARLIAGLEVTPKDIMGMGLGGLLKEIPSRPQPREGRAPAAGSQPRIAAIILAAGRSTRMAGPQNKLLMPLGGRPMIAHIVEAALASAARPVIVVTGNADNEVRAALAGQDVTFVHNPDYADGLSTSLRTGLAALPDDADGALVCLGDMPDIKASHLDRLIAAFDPEENRTICVPTVASKRGNPVLWGREWFEAMMETKGDTGAKHLIGENPDALCEVPMPDDAPLTDIDTQAEMESRRSD
ncbi:4-diphosphocytidyl-2C-methyl-D-erythritol synthase [Parvibaculum lavamentivorans DS-1]|uniref:4-diphosphocytidyl-2C-methyl-D-erythritol synthase n=1 Tax=Parvibaculum lavamentivorans (strain DS-1 / DSM 13023 / NCIMB 13966) TaxID=402881 RepID=A7HXC9_PARL1|nr:molybdopterin-binding/glycosyltransferase family 2 protein [Parvibaculum lavamentivorans]ABS64562.1 4-diphosphocytidyl-2C-methyl-D-erythritol synthase [Parvibaculum lavamentivorans DS-1]